MCAKVGSKLLYWNSHDLSALHFIIYRYNGDQSCSLPTAAKPICRYIL